MKKLFYALLSLVLLASCTSKPQKTIENLKEGIKGELTASVKYAAFADKARTEGLDTVAKLFEAASKSEAIHAANHTKVLETLGEKLDAFKPEFEVKSTVENLKNAIDGESYESFTMYPQFISDAKAEKVDSAELSFTYALKTELKHLEFYQKALAAVQNNEENTLPFEYAVCPACGNTYDTTSITDYCEFCGTSNKEFISL